MYVLYMTHSRVNNHGEKLLNQAEISGIKSSSGTSTFYSTAHPNKIMRNNAK